MERVGSFAYTRRVLRDLSKRSMALIDELEARMEDLSSSTPAALATMSTTTSEKKPSDQIVERSNTAQAEHLPRHTLEETIAIPSSAGNAKPSTLPIKPIGNSKDTTESGKNKHVKIGHGVRQILEKLKVETPKPTTTTTTGKMANTNHMASLVAADNSSTAFIACSKVDGLDATDKAGSSTDPTAPSAPSAMAGRTTGEATAAEPAAQMPTASSPSTPMAMTELPARETSLVDGDGG